MLVGKSQREEKIGCRVVHPGISHVHIRSERCEERPDVIPSGGKGDLELGVVQAVKASGQIQEVGLSSGRTPA